MGTKNSDREPSVFETRRHPCYRPVTERALQVGRQDLVHTIDGRPLVRYPLDRIDAGCVVQSFPTHVPETGARTTPKPRYSFQSLTPEHAIDASPYAYAGDT